MIFGWLAIALAVFSLAPSIVPGTFSIFGLLISLAALIIAVFSVRNNSNTYFITTLIIVIAGLLLVNDGLRVWYSLDLPMNIKLVLYGLSAIVIAACVFTVKKIKPRDEI